MTNNPTIDGVSRCKTCRGSGCIDNLRSVGAPAAKCPDCAPVVERQEPTPAMTEAGCQAYMDADGMIGIMHNSSMGHAYVAMRALDPEFTALQSTIAQLQARIAELESGRGEPVAAQVRLRPARKDMISYKPGVQFGPWQYTELARVDMKNLCYIDSVGYEIEKRVLYTAPPAPVAALWEIRIPDEPQNPESPAEYFYAQNLANRDLILMREGATVVAEYACLDATAALNGPDK